jgi:hypothetical protein
MKYKLVKTYPGFDELGVIHCSENKTERWRGILYYDKYPEYWEKVNDNFWWCVCDRDYIQDNKVLFKAWKPYYIECIPELEIIRNSFKTREEAEEFVLYNKPCLSIKDIMPDVSECFLSKLKKIVKSKL